MTLVLTCITPSYLIQVSDRRLTWVTGPNAGRVADDSQNKAVVVCNRLTFAYSGLAQIQSKSTDDWLVEVAASVQPYSAGNVLRSIAQRATEAFATIPLNERMKRHAFVTAGWAKFDRAPEEPLRPFIASVSNALDDKWLWTTKAAQTFQVKVLRLAPEETFLWVATGASLSRSEGQRINREIRACYERSTGPAGYVRVLAETIRRVATRSPTVGRGLLAVCMPLGALEKFDGMIVLLGAPFTEHHVTSLFIPPDGDDGVRYGPHFTCGGSVMTGVRVEPLVNPEHTVETPPWTRGPILLSERIGGSSRQDAIRAKLADDYKVAGWGLIAEASKDVREGGPLPCLLYIGPITAAREESFADPRYFLITRSAEEAQQRVDERWIGDLLQWIETRGVDASFVEKELAAVRPHPTRAEVIVAIRDSFRVHANLESGGMSSRRDS